MITLTLNIFFLKYSLNLNKDKIAVTTFHLIHEPPDDHL
ncbi:hypothetical protein Cabys_3607 [Caldithrix abyssi DSM 13497]|uniref:Uncharacterized protein n=1 Tax=Caldithrix abyssi DSM 13497 TaxID=880073 RepID=A0A1J1CDP2_CALAY|nr:hypothetical protein Cabys_3607 [Caldithrix abyssi DSM 13497]